MTGDAPSRKAIAGPLVVFGILCLAVALFLVLRPRGDELPVIGELSSFSLVDQDGRKFSLSDMAGKVWVADIIFTRCPGPCAKMTHHLAELQPEFAGLDSVRFATLTSDPDYDTPEILKRYAARFNADTSKWYFITGSKNVIRKLAVNDFKFVAVEKPAADREVPDDLFIHSTWYVLVDGEGKIRGWKDSSGSLHANYDSEDAENRSRLVRNIRRLAKQ